MNDGNMNTLLFIFHHLLLKKINNMKKIIYLVLAVILSLTASAQTATNFNCNDCDGATVDLFSKLDSGKVVVICWVMPCSSCIPASKTSYNVAQSFQASHSGRVLFYLCDDYANTSCSSLNSWANSNSIPASASSLRFSNTIIDMTHYGSTGMPKIVVVGGADHKVLYNANNAVNASELQSAINAGLIANSVDENNVLTADINLFPNPVNDKLTLSLTLDESVVISIEVFDNTGKKVYSDNLKSETGINKIAINTADFANGSYFVKISEAMKSKTIRFNIAH
jgi:hypothetical protein